MMLSRMSVLILSSRCARVKDEGLGKSLPSPGAGALSGLEEGSFLASTNGSVLGQACLQRGLPLLFKHSSCQLVNRSLVGERHGTDSLARTRFIKPWT